jgi:arginyl-tRNA synthetase
LLKLPEHVEQAIDELQIVRLCELLYEISTKLGSFYDKCRVVGSEEEASRLVLMEATRKVMKQTFDLLGMKTLEKI